jgi:hypothetical protein
MKTLLVARILQRPSTYLLDTTKAVLFYYILLKYAVRLQRHVKARGVATSIKDVHSWISRVRHGSLFASWLMNISLQRVANNPTCTAVTLHEEDCIRSNG